MLAVAGCSPAAATPQAALLTIYASPPADPWLAEAFTCAAGQGIVLSVTSDPNEADLWLRIGEQPGMTTPAYQIDTEELVIAVHPQSPIQELTVEGARKLFAGRGDLSVQVWVYPAGDDLQRAFDRLVMQGGAITSLARLAADPRQMSEALNAEANAVGVLPRHWDMGAARVAFSAGTVPVLAVAASETTLPLANLIACLQK